MLGLNTALHQHGLQILTPVLHRVTFADLNIVALVVADEGSETGERLTTGTTDAEQQAVTERLSQHAGDTGNVITSIQEENQLHLTLALGVVVLKVLLDLLDHAGQILQVLVRSVFTIHAETKVRENDSIVLKDLVLGQFEFPFGLIHEELKKHVLVGIIDHTVTEDTLVLVNPETDQV